ncbi:hypothetical protein GUJ93_ZPchr0002g26422 [Zizania palustris]|uniref:Uncharacterized protein n=1 Tax=Zizania palustris TaxID=103762 RepID=A0A8J5RDG7_ZIZPA|nr:hypothetical protein GUJ93_ZPchr0002g26422 [Zizania palustris]
MRAEMAAAGASSAWPVDFLGVAEGGLGGEALYCAVILWLSVVAWIIFTSVGDGDGDGGRGRRRRRGSRSSPVFVGAAGICDGTGPGCSGGFGPCGTCID